MGYCFFTTLSLKDLPSFNSNDLGSIFTSLASYYELGLNLGESAMRGMLDFRASLFISPDDAIQTLANTIAGDAYLFLGEEYYQKILTKRAQAIFDAYYLPQIAKAAQKFQKNTNAFDGFTFFLFKRN